MFNGINKKNSLRVERTSRGENFYLILLIKHPFFGWIYTNFSAEFFGLFLFIVFLNWKKIFFGPSFLALVFFFKWFLCISFFFSYFFRNFKDSIFLALVFQLTFLYWFFFRFKNVFCLSFLALVLNWFVYRFFKIFNRIFWHEVKKIVHPYQPIHKIIHFS